MIRPGTVFITIVLVNLALALGAPVWANIDLIGFCSDASDELLVHENRISFEKADSGNVMVDAWVVRKNAHRETTEHWKFSFRLPILKKILSGQANFEYSFFPCKVSDGRLYQALLHLCCERRLFPPNIVSASAFLRD